MKQHVSTTKYCVGTMIKCINIVIGNNVISTDGMANPFLRMVVKTDLEQLGESITDEQLEEAVCNFEQYVTHPTLRVKLLTMCDAARKLKKGQETS